MPLQKCIYKTVDTLSKYRNGKRHNDKRMQKNEMKQLDRNIVIVIMIILAI